MTKTKKIKVMIVDDSLTMRLLLQNIISQAPDMEVIATAADPLQAIEELKNIQPDVMTLDVEMPNMDGISFLKKIMQLRPLPVVMVSTLTSSGSKTALEALDIGAVDVIGKPSARAEDLKKSVDEIINKIRAASCSSISTKFTKKEARNIINNDSLISSNNHGVGDLDKIMPKCSNKITEDRPKIIAIGSSTGGPQALQEIFTKLPVNCPGIVVTQHIAVGFVPMFVKRLNTLCDVEIVEATNNTIIKNGHVYIAPTQKHLAVKYTGQNYVCCVFEECAINRHIPSVDVLFRSIANHSSNNALAIILTGMGNDGARCMKEIKDSGGNTIAQDETSSIVFGMPRMAIKHGGVNKVISLKNIPMEIMNYCKGGS